MRPRIVAVAALLVSSVLGSAGQLTPPPAPAGATPSARQLAWHEREFYGFIHFTVPAVGLRVSSLCRPDRSSSPYAMTVSSFDQRKLVPSIHMRCRMTPSLRANATRAFFVPRRLPRRAPNS